jgi:tetratricopeptide (TPR) repeat protein
VSKNIRKAQELSPQNPRVFYLVGMSYYHTPGILGGGFKKGLYYLQQAETLFWAEKKKNLKSHIPQWGFSTCLSFIGNIYLKKDMLYEARQYYNKALKINPFDKQAKKGLEDIVKIYISKE